MKTPTAFEVKRARERAALTQLEASRLVYVRLNSWQRYESGTREMHPAIWELFLMKARGAT